MKLKVNRYLFIAIIFFGIGCDYINPKSENEAPTQEPIAKAASEFLYPSDLEGLLVEGATEEDSLAVISSYVDNWVRKQLLISKAQQTIDFNEAELERKVLDYKYALMVHEYEKLKVNEKLSLEVSDEEINQYY